LIELLLECNDRYPHAEERRLFYVALTRAKKKVFLLTLKGQESEFVLELTGRHQEDLQKEFFTCPRCGGRLIKKTGQYSSFLGCANYRKTGCTYTRKLK
jgi:DNA helicase-4